MHFKFTRSAILCLTLLLAACSDETIPNIPDTPDTTPVPDEPEVPVPSEPEVPASAFIKFTDSGQRLGNLEGKITLGDLGSDGDLDALLGGQIYLNAAGTFTASEHNLGDYFNAALGDIDNDDDLDIILTDTESQAALYLNEEGTFVDSAQRLGSVETDSGSTATAWGIALGDIDDDGDLDAYAANYLGVPDQVYFNENGTFTDSGQRLGRDGGMNVALRDLDGDSDLDAFVMNYGGAQIYFNEGGTFIDSEQWLEDYDYADLNLGDFDGDNDLDVIIAGSVYFNEAGIFTKSTQSLGTENVVIGDLDNDGDIDALAGDSENSETLNVYLNKDGVFTKGSQNITINNSTISDLALGDLDGDGDLDAFVTSYRSNRVYFNEEVEIE